MNNSIIIDKEYKDWLASIKFKIQQSQIKAAIKVNTELLELYWELGDMIVEKQAGSRWGDGLIVQLSKDLIHDFPEMKGFSRRNLETIRQWYLFYNQQNTIAQQPVAQLKDHKAADEKIPQSAEQTNILLMRM